MAWVTARYIAWAIAFGNCDACVSRRPFLGPLVITFNDMYSLNPRGLVDTRMTSNFPMAKGRLVEVTSYASHFHPVSIPTR